MNRVFVVQAKNINVVVVLFRDFYFIKKIKVNEIIKIIDTEI